MAARRKRQKSRTRRTRHAPDGTRVPLGSSEGLTLHETQEFPPTREGLEALLRAAPSPVLRELEEAAARVLDQKGLPTTYAIVETGPGRWGRVTDLVKDRPHSPECFAALIVEKVALCREALARGDAATCLVEGMRLQGYVDLAGFKLWEPDAVRGAKSRKGGAAAASGGGRARADRAAGEHKTWIRNGLDVHKRKPGWSPRKIADEIAPATGRASGTKVILPHLR